MERNDKLSIIIDSIGLDDEPEQTQRVIYQNRGTRACIPQYPLDYDFAPEVQSLLQTFAIPSGQELLVEATLQEDRLRWRVDRLILQPVGQWS